MSLLRLRGTLVGLCALVLLSSCATGISNMKTAQLYYDLGNAYSQLGESEKATAAYLNALRFERSFKEATYNLARVYIEAGKYRNAIALLDRMLAKDPSNLIALDTLGYAYYKSGDNAKALSMYEKVLTLSPLDSNALYNSGIILASQKHYKEALTALQKLYRINSEASVLLPLGRIELALGDDEAAVRYLVSYRAAKPDDFEAAVVLAEAYSRQQLYDKTIQAYDAALKIKPESPSVLFDKAEVLLTAIQDAQGGMSALQAAVRAGFNDRVRAAKLVANPELIDRQEVERYLAGQGLVTQPGPAATQPPVSGVPKATKSAP